MKGKKATLKAEEAEIYQPLKVKTSSKQNLYERMRVDQDEAPPAPGGSKKNVRAVQAAAANSPKAATVQGKERTKGPFGRLANNNARSKRGKNSHREATIVMVKARPRRDGAAVVVVVNANPTTTTPNAVGLPPSPPPRTASPPQRPSAPPSRSSRSRVQHAPVKHGAPSEAPTAVTTKKTTTSSGVTGTAKPNVDTQPPSSIVKPQCAPPAAVSPTKPVAQAKQPTLQEDWLSKLIPDDAPGAAAGALVHQATPEELMTNRPHAVVVDFAHNDFSTMFDSHNDSDSIIWDPHAEVMASFPCFSMAQDVVEAPVVGNNTVMRSTDAMMNDEEAMLATDALAFLQVSDPDSIPASSNQDKSRQEIRAPETEDGPAPRSHGPPMSTVLVCKVTATTTTATTTSQSTSSSSNSSTSSGNSNPAQRREKERRDDYEEDEVSDMETDGVEDNAPKGPGRAAMPSGGNRIPPRPTKLEQPTHVPPTGPPREGMERKLSFSSLQMMLDKHSTHRHSDAVDNESLEDFFRDDDSLLNDDDEEIDPGHAMDGKEDTYSFIGADYSFGADRSLISLLP